MTTNATILSSTQLRTRAIAREAGLIVGLAGLTTLASKVAIPLPWTPVPATLQVAAVVFAGSAFGVGRGALSQLLFLVLGFSGLPVFAEPILAGPAVALCPTFGYLLSFPVAAGLAGTRFARGGSWLPGGLALGVIYLVGLSWLLGFSAMTGTDVSIAWALMAGVLPFLPFDLLKTGLAVWSATSLRRRFGNSVS